MKIVRVESFAVALLTLGGACNCRPVEISERALDQAGLLIFIANMQVNDSV